MATKKTTSQHQCCIMKSQQRIKAIKAGITEKNVNKYYPETTKTEKGHLNFSCIRPISNRLVPKWL
eukprot:scaffold109002_cov50-Cyclotella_meneghiniana.AAC.1